jgi:catechol 2,3-dioxygenase-like lactoylglutathione lyase family enzyme
VVTLGVSDLAVSRRFYEEGLGWHASSASVGDVVFFQAGGVVLALYPRRLLARDAKVRDDGRGFGGITLAHNVPNQADVDRVLSEVERAGARILKRAIDTDWGGRSGYFADPDGHPWEVAWAPMLPITDEGTLALPR